MISLDKEYVSNYSDKFTDRKDATNLFVRKLRKLSDKREKGEDCFYVLTYYGIGGLGKTKLRDHLISMIDNTNGNFLPSGYYCDYVMYDFEYQPKCCLAH